MDEEEEIDKSESKISELLGKFEGSRDKIEGYIDNLEKLEKNVSKIFPENIDYRNKFQLEEKLKATTAFYTSLLSMRQAFEKNITSEIEIRRKIKLGNSGDLDVDIRNIIIREEKKITKQKIKEETLENEDIDSSIDDTKKE